MRWTECHGQRWWCEECQSGISRQSKVSQHMMWLWLWTVALLLSIVWFCPPWWKCGCILVKVRGDPLGPHECGKNGTQEWEWQRAEVKHECEFWRFGRQCIDVSTLWCLWPCGPKQNVQKWDGLWRWCLDGQWSECDGKSVVGIEWEWVDEMFLWTRYPNAKVAKVEWPWFGKMAKLAMQRWMACLLCFGNVSVGQQQRKQLRGYGRWDSGCCGCFCRGWLRWPWKLENFGNARQKNGGKNWSFPKFLQWLDIRWCRPDMWCEWSYASGSDQMP